MEINKQLFEDVLSGKLKGKFVLRNGEKIHSSTNLHRNYNQFKSIYPYKLGIESYTSKGLYCEYGTSRFDIIDFIPDTNMKENELIITIPDNKVVDWDESKKQNKIVLKDKQLTYKDICKKLFENKEFFFTNAIGTIESSSSLVSPDLINAVNNSTSYHQLKCIIAKNMLANTAKYLNDGWKPAKTKEGHFDAWVLYTTPNEDFIGWVKISNCSQNSNVLFKSPKLIKQAIEILGEETIKLALKPLGI